MTVDTITDPRDFAALRNEWTDLLAMSDANCVFLTWEWLNTWWRHLGGRRQLTILTVRTDGRLVGILPLAQVRTSLGRLLRLASLEFLGSGQVGSDYLDIISRRGHEADVIDALAAHIDTRHATLKLTQLDSTTANAWQLGDAMGGVGWRTTRAVTSACPFIDLRALDWQGYLNSRSASLRYTFGRKLRTLQRRGEVVLDTAATDQARVEALQRLISFHLEHWVPRGGSDGFGGAELRAFHEEFSRLALSRGWLRLFTLRVGQTPVAGFYCLRYGKTMMFYQSGCDARWAAQSVGVVAMGLAIKAAISEGADTFDLLHGEEPYKFRWAGLTRPLARLELYPASLAGTLRSHTVNAARVARRAARWVRSGVNAAHVTGHP